MSEPKLPPLKELWVLPGEAMDFVDYAERINALILHVQRLEKELEALRSETHG